MNNKLLALIREFTTLIDSLLTLSEHDRHEHQQLIHQLESLALSVKGKTTLEESHVNQARSLFVQIYRMNLSRGRREVFFEKAEAIEREAQKVPYVASLYLNDEELRAAFDAVDIVMFDRHKPENTGSSLERAHEKLKYLVRRLNNS